MKNILKITILFIVLITSSSCEDVVDIPLENANPKLVIDANIQWLKGTPGETQTIKLSLTNDFYSNEIKIASGATVTVTDSDNTIFTFLQTPNTPDYVCTNFVPVINKSYTLKVIYEGQTYTATNKLLATPNFEPVVEQTTVPGVGNEDFTKLQLFFQDNGSEDNYYLLGAKNPKVAYPEYGVIEDRFFQGNKMFGVYMDEKIEKGELFKFTLQSITKSYFNYMTKLISISSQNSGNPFATPPATLRGNILNQTSEENHPLGYFTLAEIDKREYTIK